MAEGQHLTTLSKAEVVIHILQGIGSIGTWGYSFHHKTTPTVCTRDAQHGLRLKGRVGQIIVESYHDTLYRLEVRSIKHIARHLEGVDALASRESEGIRT